MLRKQHLAAMDNEEILRREIMELKMRSNRSQVNKSSSSIAPPR